MDLNVKRLCGKLVVETLVWSGKVKGTIGLQEWPLHVEGHSRWRVDQDRVGTAKELVAVPGKT